MANEITTHRQIDNVAAEEKSLSVIDEQEVLGKHFVVYGTAENPLFLAKDVAEWIEYAKTGNGDYDVSSMLKSVDEDEKVQMNTTNIFRSKGNPNKWFLTENGLYEVLMLSSKPIAKKKLNRKKGEKNMTNEITAQSKKTEMMTTRELAEALEVDVKTVNNTAERLRDLLGSTSQKVSGGRPTKLFTEEQATLIKQEIQRHHNLASRQVDNVATESETLRKIQEGYTLLLSLANSYKARAETAEKTNAVLMHVSKTYTATEIAKELGLRSAIELNKRLEEKAVQFFCNGTWIPRADYADCGYFEIKQEVLDNGKVIYHRRITQIGRKFILGLLSDNQGKAVPA